MAAASGALSDVAPLLLLSLLTDDARRRMKAFAELCLKGELCSGSPTNNNASEPLATCLPRSSADAVVVAPAVAAAAAGSSSSAAAAVAGAATAVIVTTAPGDEPADLWGPPASKPTTAGGAAVEMPNSGSGALCWSLCALPAALHPSVLSWEVPRLAIHRWLTSAATCRAMESRAGCCLCSSGVRDPSPDHCCCCCRGLEGDNCLPGRLPWRCRGLPG